MEGWRSCGDLLDELVGGIHVSGVPLICSASMGIPFLGVSLGLTITEVCTNFTLLFLQSVFLRPRGFQAREALKWFIRKTCLCFQWSPSSEDKHIVVCSCCALFFFSSRFDGEGGLEDGRAYLHVLWSSVLKCTSTKTARRKERTHLERWCI